MPRRRGIRMSEVLEVQEVVSEALLVLVHAAVVDNV